MKTHLLSLIVLTLFSLSAFSLSAAADESSVVAGRRELIGRAGQLLASRCWSCHGAEKQEGGLRLDSLAASQKGGDRGPALIPGDAKSLLLQSITFADADLQMPPKQKLSDAEIAVLVEWVTAGAEWPEVMPSSPDKNAAAGDAFTDPENPIRKLFAGERLDLWSLKTPARPDVPSFASHPIDAFVRRDLNAAGLQPADRADRRTLIRRVTLDLTGLPPTPEDVEHFVNDASPNAWEMLVDRLLASPRYGERQAQQWLDVVRYADTNGYERDEFRPLGWQFRDYVIRSFNHDKPFDQFVREQLAGDELLQQAPTTADESDMLIATGYLRLGQWDSTAAIFQEADRLRAEELADLTNTTASAFLGLTYSCCQCHDHKYDPLSQADHYRLRAFFAGVVPKDGQVIETVEQLSRIQTHNAELDEQINRLNAEIAQLPAGESSEELKAETDRKVAELTSRKLSPRLGMAAVDTDGDIPATHVLYQGDFNSPREEVSPGFPSVLNPQPASIDAPHETTTGRRLALANWIVSDQNPWTARVLVNRIWQQHFGVGIVATPNDFGYTGGRPTHPELLDWLATEFQRQGWSVKRLHRLIVTSETYCQSSRQTTDDSAEVKADPHNQLLWRQNLRRLEAEALRDSLLAVSGLLQTHHSGRPRWPAVPEELLKAQPAILEAMKDDDGGRMQGWYTDPVEDTDVRSVFLIRKRSLPIPFLQAFDLPESTVSCARRETTVVAPQALFLLNSPEGIRFATALADRISQVVGDDTDTQITQLFRLALLRSPDQDERLLAVQFLTHHAAAYSKNSTPAASGKSALVDLCRAVLNSNEFVYVD